MSDALCRNQEKKNALAMTNKVKGRCAGVALVGTLRISPSFSVTHRHRKVFSSRAQLILTNSILFKVMKYQYDVLSFCPAEHQRTSCPAQGKVNISPFYHFATNCTKSDSISRILHKSYLYCKELSRRDTSRRHDHPFISSSFHLGGGVVCLFVCLQRS